MVSAKNIDFSNVREGGNFNKNRIPAGDYLATITKVEDAESKADKAFQYLFSVKIDKHPSRVLPYYCKLQENQLWKLRNILIAGGLSVPKKKMKVDPSRLVGKKIGVTVEDAEYEGREQSEIAGVFPAAELVDGAEDAPGSASDDEDIDTIEDLADEEDITPAGADDEEEDDEEEADPYADLDRTALKAELKKRDSSFQARKSQTDDDLRQLLREQDAKKASGGVSDDELEELDIDDI